MPSLPNAYRELLKPHFLSVNWQQGTRFSLNNHILTLAGYDYVLGHYRGVLDFTYQAPSPDTTERSLRMYFLTEMDMVAESAAESLPYNNKVASLTLYLAHIPNSRLQPLIRDCMRTILLADGELIEEGSGRFARYDTQSTVVLADHLNNIFTDTDGNQLEMIL